MPNSFQFIDKSTGEAEKFAVIDKKLCAFLSVECHPTKYFRGWYDAFGELAAMGYTFQQMRDKVYADQITDDDEMLGRMLGWFDEHYTTTAWYMSK